MNQVLSRTTASMWADKHETAADALNKLMRARVLDVAKKSTRKIYKIFEFPLTGSSRQDSKNNSVSLLATHLDIIIAAKQRSKLKSYISTCQRLSDILGLPNIAGLKLPHQSIRKVKPLAELQQISKKYQNKRDRARNAFIKLCDGDDSGNIKTKWDLHLSAITWVINGGAPKSYLAIAHRILHLTIQAEKDRLFHLRRHAKKPELQKCFQDDILTQIKVLKSCLISPPEVSFYEQDQDKQEIWNLNNS